MAAETTAITTIERLSYKPGEAAAALGVSKNRVFEYLRTGQLESVKRGGVRLIPRRAIERFLEPDTAQDRAA